MIWHQLLLALALFGLLFNAVNVLRPGYMSRRDVCIHIFFVIAGLSLSIIWTCDLIVDLIVDLHQQFLQH